MELETTRFDRDDLASSAVGWKSTACEKQRASQRTRGGGNSLKLTVTGAECPASEPEIHSLLLSVLAWLVPRSVMLFLLPKYTHPSSLPTMKLQTNYVSSGNCELAGDLSTSEFETQKEMAETVWSSSFHAPAAPSGAAFEVLPMERGIWSIGSESFEGFQVHSLPSLLKDSKLCACCVPTARTPTIGCEWP